MSIDALALLRIPGWQPAPELFAIALGDAFLVPTTAPFASEPDELGLALRTRVGEALDRHTDPRGVFCVPDVASPTATSYDAVVEEIGEAGVWAPLVPSGYVPERLRNAVPGSFEAISGQIMGAMDPGTMEELQRAMMSGDADAFGRVQEQMMAALSKLGDPEEIARSLMASLPSEEEIAVEMGRRAASGELPDCPVDLGALDLGSPDMQALIAKAEADLAADPERRARLEQLLRGGGGEPDENDRGDEGDPRRRS
jgi:hypothetical protein